MTAIHRSVRLTVLPAGLLLALSLTACERPAPPTAPPEAEAAEPALPTEAPPPITDAGTPPINPAPSGTPPATTPDDPAQLARWDGYGDMKFGMDAAAMRTAWGGEFQGGPLPEEGPDSCYFFSPVGQATQADLAFMLEGGKFVRYGAESPRVVAPGGGKTGMTAAEIEALYPGRIETSPHKYVPRGKYLTIAAPDGATKLVFEADDAGRITDWRLGVEPQVGYVEGCS